MSEPNSATTLGDLGGRVARMANARLDKTEIDAVLAAFARRNGLPEMVFDETGLIELTIGEDLPLALSLVDQFPGLLAMARLPEDIASNERAVRELLAANLSWEETAGGTFAKLPGSDVLAYCRLISLAEQDDVLFETELLGFAETAQALIGGIELFADLEGSEADEAEPEAV